MVDFASGLMSFATGVVKGGIEQQRRRDERELGIIEAAVAKHRAMLARAINQAQGITSKSKRT